MTPLAAPSRPVVRLRAPVADATFRALGTDVRLIAGGPGAAAAVAAGRAQVLDYHARLSRFVAASELSALNRDSRAVVSASALLRAAVGAGLQAAARSDGLVDPCVHDALVAAGYARSFRPAGGVPLPTGPPRPATPDPAARWRSIEIDDDAGTIARPPGLRLDLGGSGKGHVADLVAHRFASLRRWVVDCGGDVRVGGARTVHVAHPLRAHPALRLRIADAAIATSSIVARAWLMADGRRAHHLIDPGSGRPVWSGLLSATALARTTLEAETLAKTALLRGAEGARLVLAARGGLIVHADGAVEPIGPLPEVER